MRWTEQPIFFVDFEGSLGSGVLEYGVATLLGGCVTDTRTRFCAATGRVRPEDTAVHGLRPEAVAAQPPLAADWEYFAGLRERGPLAAHYAGAENSLLKAVWPYPRRSPDFARAGAYLVDWGPWIDSARIYAQVRPGLAAGGLQDVISGCGLQAELDALAAVHCPRERRGYHAALYDALAGALLLGVLARDERYAGLTVRQLLTFSTLDPRRREGLVQDELF
jgi:DNA polymerase-3 subunit epsilon